VKENFTQVVPKYGSLLSGPGSKRFSKAVGPRQNGERLGIPQTPDLGTGRDFTQIRGKESRGMTTKEIAEAAGVSVYPIQRRRRIFTPGIRTGKRDAFIREMP
jgi:hypothetical protein